MVRKRAEIHPLNSSKTKSKKIYYILALVLIVFVCVTSFIKAIRESLFFSNRDRINFVVYGAQTQVYSLGLKSAGNYIIAYDPDIKLQVPGGYGYYRTGALGKLVYWEKQPSILTNTFSLSTNSFVDYYFFPNDGSVYFGGDPYFGLPSKHDLLFQPSNAKFFDKLYLALYFLNINDAEFKHIPLQSEKTKTGDRVLNTEQFETKYNGYLFEETYRNDSKSIQILYKDRYVNADRIAKVIQGNGIRVSDMSSTEESATKCYLRENQDTASITAKVLIKFFDCDWEKGKTDIYDILFVLGNKEKEWEVNDN